MQNYGIIEMTLESSDVAMGSYIAIFDDIEWPAALSDMPKQFYCPCKMPCSLVDDCIADESLPDVMTGLFVKAIDDEFDQVPAGIGTLSFSSIS